MKTEDLVRKLKQSSDEYRAGKHCSSEELKRRLAERFKQQ